MIYKTENLLRLGKVIQGSSSEITEVGGHSKKNYVCRFPSLHMASIDSILLKIFDVLHYGTHVDYFHMIFFFFFSIWKYLLIILSQ